LSETGAAAQTLLLPESALKLNATGARIIGYCDGQRSVAEIISALQQEFKSADPLLVEKEVNTFLLQLQKRGAVRF
jgi:pyrroloquinoline quinone biosynthesis protein D